jgi:hypothetical protein
MNHEIPWKYVVLFVFLYWTHCYLISKWDVFIWLHCLKHACRCYTSGRSSSSARLYRVSFLYTLYARLLPILVVVVLDSLRFFSSLLYCRRTSPHFYYIIIFKVLILSYITILLLSYYKIIR